MLKGETASPCIGVCNICLGAFIRHSIPAHPLTLVWFMKPQNRTIWQTVGILISPSGSGSNKFKLHANLDTRSSVTPCWSLLRMESFTLAAVAWDTEQSSPVLPVSTWAGSNWSHLARGCCQTWVRSSTLNRNYSTAAVTRWSTSLQPRVDTSGQLRPAR